jgi:2-C-methyl-D-erythritol 4-phosphate cytidylyltransferase
VRSLSIFVQGSQRSIGAGNGKPTERGVEHIVIGEVANSVVDVTDHPRSDQFDRPASTAAVILAAGSGQRFGRPKQFEMINEMTLLDRVVSTARSVCHRVVVVVPSDYEPGGGPLPARWNGEPVHAVVRGGTTHGESARAGLRAVPDDVDVVVLTSASHPLAGADLYHRTIDKVRQGFDAAAPIGHIADAVKKRRGDMVVQSLDKSNLVMVQSPGAFKLATLRRAYQHLDRSELAAPPEELEMIERIGGTVALVEGQRTNIHVTTPLDLEMARRLAELVPSADRDSALDDAAG